MNDDEPSRSSPLDPDGGFDRYRDLALIGTGGFGSVYLAYDPKHDRRVAIKVLRLDNVADDDPADTHARFLREIKVSAQVHSPYVAALHGAGVHKDHPYMVMEYVDGTPLDEIIDERGRLELDEGIRVGRELAAGLLAIHSHRLVHRDIKPANVLVDRAGEVKIIDLGMARVFQSLDGHSTTQLTMAGTLIGSPDYISPEAAEDAHQAGPKSDCYSFAATMFHAFTGRTLFTDTNPMKVIYAHLKEAPPSFGEFLLGANKRLVKTLDRCLVKNPDRRPTAMQLVDVFRHL